MDILTHYMVGYFIAKKYSKSDRLTRAITLAAVIPDIDFVFMLFGFGIGATMHRGFTHSILGVALISLFFFIFIFKAKKGAGIKPYIYMDFLRWWCKPTYWQFSCEHFIEDHPE